MNCAGVAPSIANISTWVAAGEGGGTGLSCCSPPVSSDCVTNAHEDSRSINAAIMATNAIKFLRGILIILSSAGVLCNRNTAPHVLLDVNLRHPSTISIEGQGI